MNRSYSLTLPMGTQVEIVIPGASLVASTSILYKEIGNAGWGYEDCLTMRALYSINGVLLTDLNQVMALDIKEFLALKTVVINLVEPSAQQLQDSISTLVLLQRTLPDNSVVLNPDSAGDVDAAEQPAAV